MKVDCWGLHNGWLRQHSVCLEYCRQGTCCHDDKGGSCKFQHIRGEIRREGMYFALYLKLNDSWVCCTKASNICRKWLKGIQCQGSTCKKSHFPGRDEEGREYCRHWLLYAECRNRDECKYRHVDPESLVDDRVEHNEPEPDIEQDEPELVECVPDVRVFDTVETCEEPCADDDNEFPAEWCQDVEGAQEDQADNNQPDANAFETYEEPCGDDEIHEDSLTKEIVAAKRMPAKRKQDTCDGGHINRPRYHKKGWCRREDVRQQLDAQLDKYRNLG